jgi:hypothetical protein
VGGGSPVCALLPPPPSGRAQTSTSHFAFIAPEWGLFALPARLWIDLCWGRRPSTAALTRLGARKASEMVILTCRTLHFSRVQSCATVVTRPETTSSNHRRPRAMALTKRARRPNYSRRTSLRDALRGSRIWRDLLDGGFCHGIVIDRSSGESNPSSAFSDLS